MTVRNIRNKLSEESFDEIISEFCNAIEFAYHNGASLSKNAILNRVHFVS